MPVDLRIGDVIMMRKVHPCGGLEWEITRVGADIGVKCLTCGRRIMVERDQFERQMKSIRRLESD
jgi:hypothetical protein